MAKKVGVLIKEARTAAGLTQEQLAKKVDGVSASDISKAERGEKDLTQAALRQIAKATGVTQTSLVNAPKGGSNTGKTGSSSSSHTSQTHSSGSSTASTSSVKVTASEKKMLDLYRKADASTKKSVMKLLKGEKSEAEDMLGSLIGTAMDMFSKK